MSVQIRVIEEADGRLQAEIETSEMEFTFELSVEEAADLLSELSALLQDREYRS